MNAKREYKQRVWNDAEHTTTMLIDGVVTTMIDMSLLARNNNWDDATARRASSHIAHNPELYNAVKSIGNWIVPVGTIVVLPPTGTKRSSWGIGIHRVIVGLNDEQLAIVVGWGCRVRYPKTERDNVKNGLNRDGTPKRGVTTTTATAKQMGNVTTTTPETIVHNGVKKTIDDAREKIGDYRDGIKNNELARNATAKLTTK